MEVLQLLSVLLLLCAQTLDAPLLPLLHFLLLALEAEALLRHDLVLILELRLNELQLVSGLLIGLGQAHVVRLRLR